MASGVFLMLGDMIVLACTPFMFRMQGQGEYGVYGLINAIVGYFAVVDFVFGSVTIRCTIKYNAEGVGKTKVLFGMFIVLYRLIGVVVLCLELLLLFFANGLSSSEIQTERKLIFFAVINLSVLFLIERKFSGRCVNVLWSGRNDLNKNARLLLDSLAKCASENFRCTFVGEVCAELSAHVEDENRLSRLSFSNDLPREKVLEMYKNAHLLVITSAMEANTTVLFEAMENCVPVMTVDHCGMADVVKHDSTGIKIPVSDYESMCAGFAKQIDRVCENPSLLKTFAMNIKSSSFKYSQEYRMDFFEKCYEDAIMRRIRTLSVKVYKT